jgi:hypothetical protein
MKSEIWGPPKVGGPWQLPKLPYLNPALDAADLAFTDLLSNTTHFSFILNTIPQKFDETTGMQNICFDFLLFFVQLSLTVTGNSTFISCFRNCFRNRLFSVVTKGKLDAAPH